MDIVLEFLQDKGWLHYVTAAVTIASVIASVTPTPKEGGIWAKVYKSIDWLALNVGKAKEKGKEDEVETGK
ncbi:MAG TPA: hypothetical protein HPP54_08090 [Nitrospinae bacterium]|jgi:hypothetical protein|nr:hypothetical protein [Nitrospinota bacterium]